MTHKNRKERKLLRRPLQELVVSEMEKTNKNLFLKDNLISKLSSESSSEWLPLWMHSLDAAGIMKKLVQEWLPLNIRADLTNALPAHDLQKLCVFSAYVHDIGLATAVHQSSMGQYLPIVRERAEGEGISTEPKESFVNSRYSPHYLASEAILLRNGVPPGVCCAIGAHHGKPRAKKTTEELLSEQFTYAGRNYFGYNKEDGKEDRRGKCTAWNAVWDTLIEDALSVSGYRSVADIPEIDIRAQIILSALIVMTEWICSNTEYFPLIPAEEYDSEALSGLYPQRVDEAWGKLALPTRWSPCHKKAPVHTTPNKIQAQVLSIIQDCESPGIFLLETPIGEAKTEVALAMAEQIAAKTGAGGVFLGCPSAAAAASTYPLFEEWVKAQTQGADLSIRLIHEAAQLHEDYNALPKHSSTGGLIAHPWFEGWQQATLSNFVIGDTDEFLMVGAKQKYFMLRHLGLAGKVVIIEDHPNGDVHRNAYLDRAIQWMGQYQVPVIFLSSSLPEQRRSELVSTYTGQGPGEISRLKAASTSYSLLTWTDGKTVKQKTLTATPPEANIRIEHIEENDVVQRLKQATAKGGCAGVILNSAKRAQAFADTVREQLPTAHVILLHEHLLLPDRAERERLIIRKVGKASSPAERKKVIVIGARGLEQIRGISFDYLISDFCPADILFKRMEKLRQPSSAEQPCIGLLGARGELDPSSFALYDEWLLLKTRWLLPKVLSVPKDIPVLTQHLYQSPTKDTLPVKGTGEIWESYCRRVSDGTLKAAFRLPTPDSFPSCFTNPTMVGMLETNIRTRPAKAKAVVCGNSKILSVLLMVRYEDGTVGFLPWQHHGKKVPHNEVPTEHICRAITSQRLDLPASFGERERAEEVIAQIEEETALHIPAWRQSLLLKNEFVLLLDESLQTELAGTCIQYDRENGLTLSKKEGDIFELTGETV